MFAVDTNLLLYAVNSAAPQYPKARARLAEWLAGGEDVLLTWGIVYEFLAVATHRAVFPHPLSFAQAWALLDPILSNPRVRVLTASGDDHVELLRSAVDEVPTVTGSLFQDLHTALLMRGEGIAEIRTSDADFHRFPWLRPVDPLAPDRRRT